MKNLLILFILTILSEFNLSAQNGGACVFMLPDSTVICYTTGNSGTPSINACGADALAAGALPMDCLASPFVGCASWYVTTGISCFFGGTGNCASGSACDVITLPIELVDFYVLNKDNVNNLYWTTASEINNDYFIVENSEDGYVWETVVIIKGAGNSTIEIVYDFSHEDYKNILNYYRLTQVDFDGRSEVFKSIAIDNIVEPKVLVKTINLMGQEVDENYKGIKALIYSDNSVRKVVTQ
jgi:hypothetical protein